MNTIFLVVERRCLAQLSEDDMYRAIVLMGRTMKEPMLRSWAKETWNVPIDAPLSVVREAIGASGWIAIKVEW